MQKIDKQFCFTNDGNLTCLKNEWTLSGQLRVAQGGIVLMMHFCDIQNGGGSLALLIRAANTIV